MQSHWRGVVFPLGRDVLILLGLVLTFILSATTALYVAMRRPVVIVPNLVGQRLTQAEETAHRAGFEALEIKSRVYHETAPINTIVEQWPRAGMPVKQGLPLRVSVSLGPAARSGKPPQ